MRKRRLLATMISAATGAGAASAGLSTAVFASDEWCEVDPPVQIITPNANRIVVFVVDAAAEEYREFIKRPAITYSVVRAKGGGTQVTLTVVIPLASGVSFPVRSCVWSSPGQAGQLLSELRGTAGETLSHSFHLDEA
jgi:hypothetical protein